MGIDVHRAARVAALAHGGLVIVSASTGALLEDEPLLGEHQGLVDVRRHGADPRCLAV